MKSYQYIKLIKLTNWICFKSRFYIKRNMQWSLWVGSCIYPCLCLFYSSALQRRDSYLKIVATQLLWKTLKTELSYDPAVPPLGIYPKEIKTGYLRDIFIFTPMFITALVTIVKIWKQPKCLSTDKCIFMKMFHVYLWQREWTWRA